MVEYEQQERFTLGAPAVVCRWRLRDGRLALANRHMRAFSKRVFNGGHPTPELAAWVKQHMEWTLDKTSAPYEDGVLMVLVDKEGRAAMASAPYEPLADVSAEALAARAKGSRAEADETGVAPEVLVGVRDGSLVAGLAPGDTQSGSQSFIFQLATTMGLPLRYEESLPDVYDVAWCDELFLVSDEHGVVTAEGRGGPVSRKLADAFEKILADAAKKKR